MNQKLMLLSDEFYWDDMEGSTYRGVHNPNELFDGHKRPYLSIGSMLRIQQVLEKDYNSSQALNGLKFRFLPGFMVEFSMNNSNSWTVSAIVEKHEVYYPFPIGIQWEAVNHY